MVGAAEHDQVVDAGGAAVFPLDDVVDLAPAGWSVASGVGAAVVAGGDGAADVGRDRALGPADVEGFAVRAQHHGQDPGVAQHPRQLAGGELAAHVEQGAAGAGFQLGEPDGDRGVRAFPGHLAVVLVAQGELADLHHRGRVLLRHGGTAGLRRGTGAGVERGEDGREHRRVVEHAVDRAGAVEVAVHAQLVRARPIIGLGPVEVGGVEQLSAHDPHFARGEGACGLAEAGLDRLAIGRADAGGGLGVHEGGG